MTSMANLTMPLTPVRSVIHVNLTQHSIQMSSIYYNNIESTLECDTHANTCFIGHRALILNYYEMPVTVYVYYPILLG